MDKAIMEAGGGEEGAQRALFGPLVPPSKPVRKSPRHDEVAARVAAHIPVKDIACELGMTKVRVYQIIHREGIVVPPLPSAPQPAPPGVLRRLVESLRLLFRRRQAEAPPLPVKARPAPKTPRPPKVQAVEAEGSEPQEAAKTPRAPRSSRSKFDTARIAALYAAGAPRTVICKETGVSETHLDRILQAMRKDGVLAKRPHAPRTQADLSQLSLPI